VGFYPFRGPDASFTLKKNSIAAPTTRLTLQVAVEPRVREGKFCCEQIVGNLELDLKPARLGPNVRAARQQLSGVSSAELLKTRGVLANIGFKFLGTAELTSS
jgi:hypothetical protein